MHHYALKKLTIRWKQGKEEHSGQSQSFMDKEERSLQGKEGSQVNTQVLAQASSLFLECHGWSKKDNSGMDLNTVSLILFPAPNTTPGQIGVDINAGDWSYH